MRSGAKFAPYKEGLITQASFKLTTQLKVSAGICTQSSEHSRQAHPRPKSFSFQTLEMEPRALHSRPGFYH